MKKIGKVFLLCGILMTASIPVFANVDTAIANQSLEQRGFDRDYSTRINNEDFVEVMSDRNANPLDDTIRIWQQGDGQPGSEPEIIYKLTVGGESTYHYLTDGQMEKIQIGNGQKFTIEARYNSTSWLSGTINTTVSLDTKSLK